MRKFIISVDDFRKLVHASCEAGAEYGPYDSIDDVFPDGALEVLILGGVLTEVPSEEVTETVGIDESTGTQLPHSGDDKLPTE